MSVALRTDCDQTKGAVGIMYFVDASVAKPIFASKVTAKAIIRLRSVMPLRMAVVHLCYDEPMWRHIIPLAVAAASRAALPRLIQHYGTSPFSDAGLVSIHRLKMFPYFLVSFAKFSFDFLLNQGRMWRSNIN